MNRREILRYTAWITGSAVSASLAGAILSGCSEQTPDKITATSTEKSLTSTILHFFTPEQFALVALLADTILPRTDSPSATDVNVHTSIDSMLGLIVDSNYQTGFKSRWLELQNYLQQQNFSQLAAQAQLETLQTLELTQEADLNSTKNTLVEFKQQVIAYYLTTEEVAKKFLNYLPIPGSYQPCISVDDVNNKAWAI
jgi:hypothetical protein